MMKNFQGFTLAEVLITLVIIGIIAAMTILTLMNNTMNKKRLLLSKGLFCTRAGKSANDCQKRKLVFFVIEGE